MASAWKDVCTNRGRRFDTDKVIARQRKPPHDNEDFYGEIALNEAMRFSRMRHSDGLPGSTIISYNLSLQYAVESDKTKQWPGDRRKEI